MPRPGEENGKLLFRFVGSCACLSLGSGHRRFGIPEVWGGSRDLVGRIAQIRAETIDSGIRVLFDLSHGLFEFGHAFLTEDIREHDFLIKVAE